MATIDPRVTRAREEEASDLLRLFPDDVLDIVQRAAPSRRPVIIISPPMQGPMMLARRARAFLPDWTELELAEYATIRALASPPETPIAWMDGADLALHRPFRAPHHSCAREALRSRWSRSRKRWLIGEDARAHGGILCLPEAPDFALGALEDLEEVIQTGQRAGVEYSDFDGGEFRATLAVRPWVFALAHPCACGWATYSNRACKCSPAQLERYRARFDTLAYHLRRADGGPAVVRWDENWDSKRSIARASK